MRRGLPLEAAVDAAAGARLGPKERPRPRRLLPRLRQAARYSRGTAGARREVVSRYSSNTVTYFMYSLKSSIELKYPMQLNSTARVNASCIDERRRRTREVGTVGGVRKDRADRSGNSQSLSLKYHTPSRELMDHTHSTCSSISSRSYGDNLTTLYFSLFLLSSARART